MPRFSEKSKLRLKTVHPELQRLFVEVIETYDCTILCGHRGEAAQERALADGHSTKHWPDSKHNQGPPCKAVDVAPCPIDWKNRAAFYHFGGYVTAVASQMGVAIRWGGDWDGDKDLKDQTFNDLVHFELVDR